MTDTVPPPPAGFVLQPAASAPPPPPAGFVLQPSAGATPPAPTLPQASAENPPSFTEAVDPNSLVVDMGARPKAAPLTGDSRQIMLGSQATGRGLAHIVGAPADLTNAVADLALTGIDKGSQALGGPAVPFRFGSLSDNVIDKTGDALQAAGMPLQEPATTGERAMGNVVDFATQGLAGGVGLARAAVKRGVQLAQPGATPSIFDNLVKPYLANPAKTVAGDAVAGAGSGAALSASQALPDSVREKGGGIAGLLADLAAQTIGGVAGGTVASAASVPGYARGKIRGRMVDRSIPYDPATGAATTNRQADAAASYAQDNTVEPRNVADAIRSGAKEYRDMGSPVPTTGALSKDPKFLALERSARTDNPGEFAARDMQLRDKAMATLEGVQPKGADPRDSVNFFRDTLDGRNSAAAAGLRAAEQRLLAAENGGRALGDSVRPNASRSTEASQALDDRILNGSLRPMDATRRAAFDAVPREATVPGEPFAEAAGRVRASAEHLPENARGEVLPVNRLQDFESFIERDTEGNVTGVRPMSFGVINDLRPIISSEMARARASGAPTPYLENLEILQRELNRATTELPEAQRAVEHFQNTYAPVWGRGAGEAYNLRKDFNVDRTNRTAAPPSATAGRFLTTGAGAREKAESLARVVQSIANPADQAAATAAVRQYVLADLTKTIGDDGRISQQRLYRWLNGPSGWNDALSQFPTVRQEVERLAADVGANTLQQNVMAGEVAREAGNVRRTQREADNSALSLTLGRDPTKAAKAVLDSKDPEMAMREVVGAIGGNERAKLSWQRAVTDHLIDRVTSVNPQGISEGSFAPDYAKLAQTFKQYDKPLAELYAGEPDKMLALQQARKMLEPLAARAPGSAPGPTPANHERAWKFLEAGLKAHYGVLKGGGVTRTLRILTSLGADNPAVVERLVERMMFDPELASQLLTRNVSDVGSPAWNSKLQKTLRRMQLVRSADEDDSDD